MGETSSQAAEIAFRVSPSGATAVGRGLGLVLARFREWERASSLPSTHWKVALAHGNFRSGRFDPQMMAAIERTAQKMASVSGVRKRLQLDAFEFAACLLALRLVHPARRLAPETPADPAATRAWEEPYTHVERHWKRAKRAYVAAKGAAAFAEASQRWKQHVLWLRLRLFAGGSQLGVRTLAGRHIWERRMRRLETWQQALRQDLVKRRYTIPPEREFRSLVRQALRAARRKFGSVQDAVNLQGSREIQQFLFGFVSKRLTPPPSAEDVLRRAGIALPGDFY